MAGPVCIFERMESPIDKPNKIIKPTCFLNVFFELLTLNRYKPNAINRKLRLNISGRTQ